MSSRLSIALGLCFASVLLTTAFVIAQSPENRIQEPVKPTVPERADDTQLFMRAKLASSQKLMEGLVTEDFAMIQIGAKQLKRISEAAHWPTTVDEVYQHYSVSFRKQCDKLTEQAERRDLQAAHYTYLHLSTTCIDCHNYVRGRFTVKRTKRGAPVQLIPTQWDRPHGKVRPSPQPDDGRTKNKTG